MPASVACTCKPERAWTRPVQDPVVMICPRCHGMPRRLQWRASQASVDQSSAGLPPVVRAFCSPSMRRLATISRSDSVAGKGCGAPVILAGDLNSWQNNQGGDRAHDALVKAGFYDTAAAPTQVNTTYTTFNDFRKTIPVNKSGWGARLDVIAGKGLVGVAKFENVMKKTSSNRPSDHNMVYADVYLPTGS